MVSSRFIVTATSAASSVNLSALSTSCYASYALLSMASASSTLSTHQLSSSPIFISSSSSDSALNSEEGSPPPLVPLSPLLSTWHASSPLQLDDSIEIPAQSSNKSLTRQSSQQIKHPQNSHNTQQSQPATAEAESDIKPKNERDLHNQNQSQQYHTDYAEQSPFPPLSPHQPQTRIIGGIPITGPNPRTRFSFAVSLQYIGANLHKGDANNGYVGDAKYHICGGSLIAPFAILTAAHCEGIFDAVVVGRYDISNNSPNDHTGQVFLPSQYQTVVHPNFNPYSFDNDFMIILLRNSIASDNGSGPKPVRLNRNSMVPDDSWLFGNPSMTVLGWGDVDPAPTNENGSSGYENADELMEAALLYVPNEECEQSNGFFPSKDDAETLLWGTYRNKIKDSMMCAHSEIVDSCQGDSGGPLIVKDYALDGGLADIDSKYHGNHGDVLFGTVSWGFGCQHPEFPGVYARVSSSINWIDEVVCGVVQTTPSLNIDLPPSFGCGNDAANENAAGTSEVELDPEYLIKQGQDFSSREEAETSTWPYYLKLDITLDDEPSQISWKFENARTSKVLDSRDFRYYGGDKAGTKVTEQLNILTNDDLEGDGIDAGVNREYRFIIYDMGGNGLCCMNGNGHYEIYSKGKLLFTGNEFGATEEKFFSVDPSDFQPVGGTNSDVGSTGDSNGQFNSPTRKPTTPKPTIVPPDQKAFFCGTTFEDAEASCHLPCPSGSPASCSDPNHTCYASTTCRERWPTYFPTSLPSESPTDAPTSPPTTAPTTPPTNPPTFSPTPKVTPKPTTHVQSIDAEKWFCGISWDWVISNCGLATPCPNGDNSACPENHACFASTPCTRAPTTTPSESPSESPTKTPTGNPTRAPWSEKAFLEFLHGVEDGEDTNGNGQGSSQSVSNEGPLASDVNEALEDYDRLQYHFFCGHSWYHADSTCNKFCPGGDEGECPDGMQCYANTRCDGRDTPPPTISPAPSVQGVANTGNKEICTICGERKMDLNVAVEFNAKLTTCGVVNNAVKKNSIYDGTPTCNSVKEAYDICCYDECHLCQKANGDFMDIRSDFLVRQGGYSATCQEVELILEATSRNEKTCSDAQKNLGEDCCYEKCSLCGTGMNVEWYATVKFQDVTTTCLGLDFMLRMEEIGDGSEECSTIRNEHSQTCCYVAPEKPCRLCEEDGVLYEMDATKIIPGRSSTSCASMNDSLAKVDSGDAICLNGKNSFFKTCCDSSTAILSTDSQISSTPGGSSTQMGQPSPGSTPTPGVASPPGGVPSPGVHTPNNPLRGPDSSPSMVAPGGPPSNITGPEASLKPTLPFFWGNTGQANFKWDPPSTGYSCYNLQSWLRVLSLSLSFYVFFIL